jgi:alpha-tubulin suppressor-like RCC1 family protein
MTLSQIQRIFFPLLMSVLSAPAATLNATYNTASDVPLTTSAYTATGNTVEFTLNCAPATGTNLTVVKNTGLGFIDGTFNNLAQGQAVTLNYAGVPFNFVANYYGGSGNDLVLQWAATRPVAWGGNSYGQLGNGSMMDSPLPVAISVAGVLSGKTVIAMAAGRLFNMALCSDGTLAAWGLNGNGQLGNGNTTQSNVPVAVSATGGLSGKQVVAVAAGGYHGLALCSDGTLAAWGANESGQLGIGSMTQGNVPVAVGTAGVLAGRKVVAITAGYRHSLVLCADGTLAAWGANSSGQLGNDSTTSSNVPVAVNLAGVLAGKAVVAVAAGGSHNLVLCADGSLAAWGANTYGQLGNGSTTQSINPVLVNTAGVLAGKAVVAVMAGGSHNLALCSDGVLAAWGYNYTGSLGNGNMADSNLPVVVSTAGVLSGKSVINMAAGNGHSLALCSDGTLTAWGYNVYGQLGNAGTVDSKVPVAVNTDVLALGEKFVAGVSAEGSLHSLGIVAVPAIPRIFVEQPAGAVLSNGGGSVDIGSATAGVGVAKTFTIRNTGMVPLTIGSMTIEGANAGDFVLSTPPATSVEAGSSTTFAVTFTSAGAGFERSAALHIASNDPYVNLFHVNLTGTVTGVLRAVYGGGSDVPLSAAAFTATGSSVDFTLNYAPAIGTTLTVVRNTGLGFIGGTFDNLAQGQMVTLSYGGADYRFVANYYGGSGNDLVLQWAANRPIAWGSNSSGQLGDGTTENKVGPVAVDTLGVLSGKSIIAMAAGSSHSLALCSDGTLAAWGGNTNGQLGNGGTTQSNVPVAVSTTGALPGKTVIAVSVGGSHSLALCSDGTLATWGSNSNGQLGNGGTTSSNTPVPVNMSGILAGKQVVAIAAGGSHNLVLCSDGTLATWGVNSSGQLGNGNTIQSNVPVSVNMAGVLAGKAVVAVAGGGSNNLVLCSDGTMASWGYNYDGRLGNGGSTASNVPVAVSTSGVLAGKTVVAMTVGGGHSLALCSDGMLVAWGYNYYGQLGNGGTTNSNVPVAVSLAGVLAGKTVVAMVGGGVYSLVRCSDDTLVAWGANESGQLGSGTTTQSKIPVTVNMSTLAVGERLMVGTSGENASHSLGIVAGRSVPRMVVEQAGGKMLSSGRSTLDFGSVTLGTGVTKMFTIRNTGTVPLTIDSVSIDGANAADFVLTTAPAASVEAGLSTTIAVTFTAAGDGFKRSAALHIAGNDPFAGTFDLGFTATVTGVLTVAYNDGSEVPLSAAAFTATGSSVSLSLNYAPTTGATLTVVRNTGPGRINGTFSNLAQGQMVTLSFGGTDYKFVANYYGGRGNDLVLQWAATRPVGWGTNTSGQLGDGTTAASTVPVAVSTAGALAGKTVTTLAAGSSYAVALCSDGTLASWGYNASGQLGNNSTTSSTVPVAVNRAGVLAGKTTVAIAVGSSHSLALCADGTLVAWGSNSSGQLGIGSTLDSKVPVAVNTAGVLSGRTVVAIAAGTYHSMALCSDGTLAAWGGNLFCELGNGTTTSSSVPVTVMTTGMLTGKAVVSIAAGGLHSLALCSDGTLAAWGYNIDGQLGNGSTTNSNVPVAVNMTGALAGKSVAAVAAGASHNLALCSDGTLAAWGDNMYGCLGDGGTGSGYPPVAVITTGVLGGRTLVAVAAGDTDSMALCADGTLATWGDNYYGQLGNISTDPGYAPVAVTTETLAAGERFLAGANSKDGRHSVGLVAMPFIPRLVVEQPAGVRLNSGSSILDLGSCAAGNGIAKTFTIKNSGIVPLSITGMSIDGANAGDFTVTTPPAASVAAGGSTTFAVTFTAGTGLSRSGVLQVATNDPYNSVFNVHLTAVVTGVLTASYGTGSEVPMTAMGFTATGSSVNLVLNYPPATGTTLMVVNNTGLGFIKGTFSNLAQGQEMALGYGGAIYRFVANYYGGSGNDLVLQWAATRPLAWGSNSYGELGNGGTLSSYVPAAVNRVGALSGKTILAAVGGYGLSLALCSDGTLAAWGYNNKGQLGNGSTVNSNVPVAVITTGVLSGKKVIAVSAGYDHCLALCSDGTLVAWGNNEYGKLGNGSYTSSSVPVAVSTAGVLAGKTVVAVAAGIYHNLALCSDGTLVSWGSGALGNASISSSNVPVPVDMAGVLSGRAVTSISGGGDLSLALCSDGTLTAWGSNGWGQLGTGSDPVGNSPVAVTGGVLSGKVVVAMAAGYYHGVALCSDGTLAAWGFNSNGQLGNGSTDNGYVPAAVNQTGALSGKVVVAVAAGHQHSLVRCSDGMLAAWGGSGGVLGNGSPSDSSVPVTVSTCNLAVGERFVSASAGNYATHNLALVAMPYIPRIGVEQPGGNGLASGRGSVDFGNNAAGTGIAKAFVIRNNGIVPLTINGMLIDGMNSDDFVLTTPPASSVAAGSSTTFVVTCTAGEGFNRSAVLHIASNDPSIGVIEINLTATVPGVLAATYNTGFEVPLSTLGFTAAGSSVNFTLDCAPATGTTLMVVKHNGLGFINGTFDNLAQGQLVALSHGGMTYQFVANYYGGSGNDLVLQWAATRPLAWGSNAYGQLGNGNYSDGMVPAGVSTAGALSGKTVIAVAAGYHHSLALCSDGSLAAWGDNSYYQLGDGSTTTKSNVPVAVNMAGVLSGRTVIAVAAGQYHSLALCSDGTLAAWGYNYYGQLGNGGTTSGKLPVAVNTAGVLSGKTVIAVAAGTYHSLALCADGTSVAWGDNSAGELGNGLTMNSSVPVAVSTAGVLFHKNVIAVAAGETSSMALCSDGTLAAWGSNTYGQLGNGTMTKSNVPVAVSTTGVLSGRTVIAAGAGNYHSLALCADGTLASWGYNSNGQLGIGSTTASNVPVAVIAEGVLAGKTVVAISAGSSYSLAQCSDGTLAAWGYNSYGQLGTGANKSSNVPVAVSTSTLAAGEQFVDGTSGQSADFSLGIVAMPYIPRLVVEQPAGTGLTSGSSTVDFASSGVGIAVPKTFTIKNNGLVPLVITDVTIDGTNAAEFVLTTPPPASVAAGSSTTFAVTFTAGAGFDRHAALHIATNDPYTSVFHLALTAGGSGDLTATYNTGLEVPLAVGHFTATGSSVSLSLNCVPTTGAALTVVNNTGLGFIQGAFSNLAQGQTVALIYEGVTYRFVANYYGGSGNDLVLQWAATRLFAWGKNSSCQLGDGTSMRSKLPAAVSTTGVLAGRMVAAVSAGYGHSLALCADGTLAAWGADNYGQLGIGNTTFSAVPLAVNTAGALAGKTVVAIAAGYNHSLALCADGTLAAWGYNSYGQLGNGSTTNSNVPVAVSMAGALSNRQVIAICAGEYHNLVLCSDGTLVAWGSDSSGQLGGGSVIQSNLPVVVTAAGALSGKAVIAVSAGSSHCLALCSDGTLVAWGANSFGQLGNGNATSSTVPVAVSAVGVLSGRTVTAVAAGYHHSLALCADGTLATWGSNTYGQLGDSSGTSSNVPVAVNMADLLSEKTVVSVSAGSYHCLARCTDGTLAAWGYNTYSQLGHDGTLYDTAPVAVAIATPPVDGRFVAGTSGQSAYHSFGLVAEPFAPGIAVECPAGTGLDDGNSVVDLGQVASGGSLLQTFTIRNPGNAELNSLAIAVDGGNADEFTVGPPGTTTLAPGATTAFAVTFSPNGLSARSAWLHLVSNVTGATNPFDIYLTGFGLTQLEQWRLTHFQTKDNVGEAGDMETPQNDGVANLIKFATGMNPALPGTMPGACIPSGDELVFTYSRSKAAVIDGLAFTVEWSDDLTKPGWSHVDVRETSADQGVTSLVTATLPAGAGPARFVRLRVERH